MEAPRALKSFLVVITLLVFFMIINILTSVNYLYRVVDVTHVVASGTKYLGTETFNSSETAAGAKTPKTQVAEKLKAVISNSSNPKREPVSPKPKPVASKPDVRPDDCAGCFIHNFTFVIHNKTICSNPPDGTIDLLMVILTVHNNVNQRNNIRASWTSMAKGNTANVRYAFLLGITKDENLMKSVYDENDKHGDILMEGFVDVYANLTYKTIMGMKWATLFCPQAKYIMKTDDDMWVNVPEMLKMLAKRGSELQKRVGGACSLTAGPIRDRASKWYASIKSYPHSSYPGFCSGTGYVTSMNVARKIYEISPNVPFFHLEDIYVSLCIRKLGFTLLGLPGFHNWRTSMDPCKMRSSSILTSHMVPTEFLLKIMAAKC